MGTGQMRLVWLFSAYLDACCPPQCVETTSDDASPDASFGRRLCPKLELRFRMEAVPKMITAKRYASKNGSLGPFDVDRFFFLRYENVREKPSVRDGVETRRHCFPIPVCQYSKRKILCDPQTILDTAVFYKEAGVDLLASFVLCLIFAIARDVLVSC